MYRRIAAQQNYNKNVICFNRLVAHGIIFVDSRIISIVFNFQHEVVCCDISHVLLDSITSKT